MEGCLHCSEDERGRNECGEGTQVLRGNRGDVGIEKFKCDSKAPVREKWIREIRGERPQGIAVDISSALRETNSSAASLPGRNESPGTHCCRIGKKKREDSFSQI